MLVAIGIVLHLVETVIPLPVQVPGVKLGLANVVTLVAFYGIGHRDAFAVAALRIFFGSVLSGTLLAPAFFLSAGGALFAFVVMLAMDRLLREKAGLPGISALASLGHVTGQLLVAAVIINHPGIFLLAPLIYFSAVVTGFLTGLIADLVLRRLIVLNLCQQRSME
jgi:heptaprenyl diphosphate synthase